MDHVHRVVRVMNGPAEIVVLGGDANMLDWAETELARLESLWSRFRPDTDVSAMNARAGTGPVDVAPETIAAVAKAVELYWCTDHLFDPTTLDSLEAHGYDRTFEDIKGRDLPEAERDRVRPAPGCSGIVLDRDAGTIELPRGVHIDLGGVGKGLAADHVAAELVRAGAAGACVSMNGDVRAAGLGPVDDRWPVPIVDPFDFESVMATCPLHDGAVVTSTRLYRCWTAGGREAHHLIDPRTGEPADPTIAAVVVAASEAWWAEGLAKAALIAGVDAGRALLERHGVTAWIVAADRDVTQVAA